MTDWPVKTLGEVCEFQNGYTFKSSEYAKNGHALIRIKNVQQGVIVPSDDVFVQIPKDGSLDQFVLSAGDILMSLTGYLGRVGRLDEMDLPAALNQRVAKVSVKSKAVLSDGFLYRVLDSRWFRDQVEVYGRGAAQQNVGTSDISKIKIPVPPLVEQRRIVELLDAATERVTELTTCYEQARTNANNLFTSALRVTLQTNLDWPVKTLGEVCDLVGGGTPSKERPEFYGGEIPWATVRDLNVEVLCNTEHSITAEAVKSSSSNIIPSGSVVIATRVGLGKAVIVAQDTAINQDLRGLVVKNRNEVLADYLYWWYLSTAHLVVDAGTGPTVQGVKLPFISGLEIPVPPLEDQTQIVARLDSMRAKTSEMVAAFDAKLTAAKNLRQSILESAFAGEL